MDVLENNLLATLGTVAVGGVLWWSLGKFASGRARRSLRVSVFLLSVPVIYLGHPLLYYPSWAILVAGAVAGNLAVVVGYLVVAGAIVLISLRRSF